MNGREFHGYTIYIKDGPSKFYLRDWIVSDNGVNLTFAMQKQYAMTFSKLRIAAKYRERMMEMGYFPHIE